MHKKSQQELFSINVSEQESSFYCARINREFKFFISHISPFKLFIAVKKFLLSSACMIIDYLCRYKLQNLTRAYLEIFWGGFMDGKNWRGFWDFFFLENPNNLKKFSEEVGDNPPLECYINHIWLTDWSCFRQWISFNFLMMII